MVKIGVIGKGGQINSHIEYFRSTSNVELSAVYITDTSVKLKTACPVYSSLDELIEISDAIYILETDDSPFEIVLKAFRNGKHVFIEHISALSLNEIEELLNSRKEANVKCMIGSTVLCHPVYMAIKNETINPQFIESQRRIANDKNDSRNIILDLMLQDLAIVLNMVKSEIKRISANGLKVMNDTVDIANARLEFSNGCVAILTVSKTGMSDENYINFYEENKVLSIDFKHSKAFTYTKSRNSEGQIEPTYLTSAPIDSFQYQLENFRDSIAENAIPLLKLREGYEKLDIAHKILKKINSFNED